MSKIKLLAIVGPTASGKTKLSVELAKRFNGEIISADSMQIYKDMNIGTAKPTKDEMQNIKHHLIDFLDVAKDFSVAEYVNLAKKTIASVSSKNKLPILCGGTGLYVNSLIDNIKFSEYKSDPMIKNVLLEKLQKYGSDALFKELQKVDPESSKKIHPNDTLRVIRALEIYKTSKITMSEHIRRSKLKESPYNLVILGLNYQNRELLYDKINKRVDLMLEQGLIEETKKILLKNPSKTALNAICYKEIIPHLNNECTKETAVENLKKASRNYAKRQLTWFNRDKRIHWIMVDIYKDFEEILERCTSCVDFGKNI